jgi:hypothetical protein
MPIGYTIDSEQRLIRTRPEGVLTINDTLEYFARLASDPLLSAEAIEIVDFSKVTDFTFHYSEMQRITRSYQTAKSTKEIVATVFFCPSELSFGVGRMLQVLHEMANPAHVVRIAGSDAELDGILRELRSDGASVPGS